jgi:hypothetical protein
MPSLLKALGAILCLVFALSFAAPKAHADYIYTVSLGAPLSSALLSLRLPAQDLLIRV